MYAIDIETNDPNLKELGDGSIRKDGEVLCVGVYGEGAEGRVRDVFLPSDPQLHAILATQDKKVFHNGVYDMTWLVNGLGLKVNGYIDDTMTREALLDEYSDSMSLDYSAKKRGLEGKNWGDTISQWAVDNGIKFRNNGQLITAAWNYDPRIVAKYCLQDCQTTYDLWHLQEPAIQQWDLQKVVDVEAGLYPILLRMKKNGIRVNTEKRDELAYQWMNHVADYRQALEEQYGLENMNSPKQITDMMHRLGIHSAISTGTGNESWGGDALEIIDHPAARLLKEAKVYGKALGTFITGYFTNCAISGRIHPTFYPSLRDEGGTITGRFSSRNPNMQNIPADDRTMGPEIRGLLEPEEGCILCAFDYKQIEYTVFIHYAIGPQAEAARQSIRDGMDYHSLAQKLLKWDKEDIQKQFGWSPHDARKMTKNFNFGSIYGLGRSGFKCKFKGPLAKGAQQAGVDFDRYCDRLYDEYFRMLPFVRPTCVGMQELCKAKGFMRSIGGRLHHRPQRRGDYAIVNYICQGGASDILKAGFVAAEKAGVFDYIFPHITVHDENVFSVYPTRASVEAAEEYGRIMTEAVQLKVPIRIDKEAGFNWADCSVNKWDEWRKKYGQGLQMV